MSRISVTLKDDDIDWMEKAIADGNYGSKDELVSALVRKAQRREAAEAELAALLKEGLESGIDPRPGEVVCREIREEILREHRLGSEVSAD